MFVRRTSTAAALAVATALSWTGAAAHATIPNASCSALGDAIQIDIVSGYDAIALSNLSDHVQVTDASGTFECSAPTSAAANIFVVSDGPTAHSWTLDLSTAFAGVNGIARVVLPNQPTDPVTVRYQGPTGQQWTYLGTMNGDNHEFTLDGGSTSDLSLQPGSGQLTLNTNWDLVDDTIDLWNNGTTPYTGQNTVIDTGDGNDTIRGGVSNDDIRSGGGDDVVWGGPGADTLHDDYGVDTFYGMRPGDEDYDSDHIFLTPDFLPDQVNPGISSGFDWVTFESFGEPINVTVNGVADDGMDGESDNVQGVAQVTTGYGEDRIDTVGLQNIDSGPGNDTLLVHQDFSQPITMWDAGTGDDTIDFSEVAARVDSNMNGGSNWFDAEGYALEAFSVEAAVGSPVDDNFQLTCACRVRPGLGNDTVQLQADGARFVADAAADGADVLSTYEAFAGTVDYSLRTTGVSLTSDGDANDGATGEGDNIDSSATTLIGGAGADTIIGSAVDNTLLGNGGANVLTGRGGDDFLQGGAGKDTLSGGAGDDRLRGYEAADKLQGGDGDDVLWGDQPYDNLTFGADTLDGGNGDDDEFGFWGNDTFLEGSAANGGDLLVGGAGTDLASYALRAAALKLTLNGLWDDGAAGEGDRIGSDIENLTGGKGADVITGNNLVNLLTGGLGKDTLSGLAGADVFQTLDGAIDSLNGGDGKDKAHRDATDKITSVEVKF